MAAPPAMKVFNAELYVEAMQASDWTPPAPTQAKAAAAPAKHPRWGTRAAGTSVKDSLTASEARHQQAEALAGKRAVLEADFAAKMEMAKKESRQRAHDTAAKNELDFKKRFEAFEARNREITGEARTEDTAGALKERHRERLYQSWMTNVFLPMQDSVSSQIAATDVDDVRCSRNDQFQRYLDESNRKKGKGGVQLDIVVESQYDPFHVSKKVARRTLNGPTTAPKPNVNGGGGGGGVGVGATGGVSPADCCGIIKYRAASISNDPLKNRVTREAGANSASTAIPGGTTLGGGGGRHDNSGSLGVSTTHARYDAPDLLPRTGVAFHAASLPKLTPPKGASSSSQQNSTVGGSGYKYNANNALFSLDEVVPPRSETVNVQQWSRMESTPHGRYSDDNVGPTNRSRVRVPGSNKGYMRSVVVMDHFTIPTGTEGQQTLQLEMGRVGKRCPPPPPPPPHATVTAPAEGGAE